MSKGLSAPRCPGGGRRGPGDVSQNLRFPRFFVVNALKVWERVMTFSPGSGLNAQLFTDLISGHS